MAKNLFILKRREDYSQDPSYSGSYQIATGMWNSAMFVSEMLLSNGKDSAVEMVVDANSIDGIVTRHNPDNVFIEGLWVTPTKFDELLAIPRHANRNWVVRIHSEIPFLATEGIAMGWIAQYLDQGLVVAPNAPRAHQQLRYYAIENGLTEAQADSQVAFLPNSYPTNFDALSGLDTSGKTTLDVACFGAFRPFKNHLQQVFIAARFADQLGLHLRFHVNNRMDQGGTPIAKNVKATVEEMGGTLIEHSWEERSIFLQSLRDCDLLLQVSMTETFNIVAADAVFVGRPILVSNEITWAYPLYADPQNVDKSLGVLNAIWANKPFFIQRNRDGLRSYVTDSTARWLRYV